MAAADTSASASTSAASADASAPAPAAATLPSPASTFAAIRDSARAYVDRYNIEIPDSAVVAFLRDLKEADYERLHVAHGVQFPIDFGSCEEELNFISILSLLNFLSGYRKVLHERAGQGAWDTVRRLMLSLHLSSIDVDPPLLSAASISSISSSTIASHAAIPLHVEKPHESLPITVGTMDKDMHEVINLLTDCLNTTGKILLDGGFRDLGDFVAQALTAAKAAGATDNGAQDLVAKLVRAFPGFRDMTVIDGQPLYVFKKALFLVQAISSRFGPSASELSFPVPNTGDLPIFADNVIVTMVLKYGLADLSQTSYASLSSLRIPTDGKRSLDLTAEEAYILRAAAITACDAVVARAKTLAASSEVSDVGLRWLGKLDAAGVDGYLWSVAKDRKELRQIERVAEKGTAFY